VANAFATLAYAVKTAVATATTKSADDWKVYIVGTLDPTTNIGTDSTTGTTVGSDTDTTAHISGTNNKLITIGGKNAAAAARIEADTGKRVLAIDNGAKVNLQHVTIAGGAITSDEGGGLLVSGANTVVTLGTGTKIGGTTSDGNTAPAGGGLAVLDSANVTIDGAEISYNTTTDSPHKGGGIYIASGGTASEVDMNGGIISHNRADNGGGVYIGTEGSFTFDAGSIIENTALNSDNNAGQGGGVFVDTAGIFLMRTNGGDSITPYCAISYNYAYNKGGGVYVAYNGTITKVGGYINGGSGVTSPGGTLINYNNGTNFGTGSGIAVYHIAGSLGTADNKHKDSDSAPGSPLATLSPGSSTWDP
jgi:hypothetical protein